MKYLVSNQREADKLSPPQRQSRTQSPHAPWSAVWSPGETPGKWNFFPRNLGFRLLCACLAL